MGNFRVSHLAAVILACVLSWPLNAESRPFIYSTDLFHPHDDPDDHVDLATMYAMPELDVRAIVLDLGRSQLHRPGSIPVKQLNAITGRNVPYAIGLAHPLRYPEDTGIHQHVGTEGPDTILRALRESTEKVIIMTVGSLRDVAAAYNRDPELMKSKVSRIYVNAGHANGALLEWNTSLDPQAYLRIMQSDLPVYFAPAFDALDWLEKQRSKELGTGPHQSYWNFQQNEIYEPAPHALQSFFLYALGRIPPTTADPLEYLKGPVDEKLRTREWSLKRNMWCTSVFYHAANYKLYRRGDEWRASQSPVSGYDAAPMLEFVPARVLIDRELRTTIHMPPEQSTFTVLKIVDVKNYSRAMLTSLRELLKSMPVQDAYKK